MTAQAAPRDEPEAAVSARWAAGARAPLRLVDGRPVSVIFPGVPGPGRGPDFTGAVIEIDGDIVRGDVEVHTVPGGWAAHGHAQDPAYARVVLHVVGRAGRAAAATLHRGGRTIPVLELPGASEGPPSGAIVPPCALRRAATSARDTALLRLGERRLRIKAARAALAVAEAGPGQALYALTLEQLGGSANRAAFASLARQLPLSALRERVDGASVAPARAAEAELRLAAARIVLQRAGLRPLAGPEPRIVAASRLCAALWPPGGPPWPAGLSPGEASATLRSGGLSKALATEVTVNAVLPVGLAAGEFSLEHALAAFATLPSPGTYGKLKPLARWLHSADERPFASAARLQGALLLHADYCTKGACGRCPLSS